VPADVAAGLPYDERSNRAPSARSVEERRRVNKLGVRSEVNPSPLMSPAAFGRLPRPLVRRVLKPYSGWADEALRARAAAAIGDRYAESNRRTAELTGLDLAAYGWKT
jgi:hypothetical protein